MFLTVGTFLFGLIGKKGVSAKAAKAVGIGALAVVVVIAIALFFVIHDHNVIKNHDARQEAKTLNAVVGADRYAGEHKEARDQNFRDSQAAIAGAVNNAVTAAPAQARKPVGPASQGYYDELRRQQRKNR